eukprot:UN03257
MTQKGEKSFLMETRTMKAQIDGANWIKLNSNYQGFYIVQYDTEGLKALRDPIAKKTLTELDRFNIVKDCQLLSQAGLMSACDVLELLEVFESEDNYYVLETIAGILKNLYHLFGDVNDHKESRVKLP